MQVTFSINSDFKLSYCVLPSIVVSRTVLANPGEIDALLGDNLVFCTYVYSYYFGNTTYGKEGLFFFLSYRA